MNPPETRPNIIRDEDFYLQHSIFLVENRLFKVPILHLVEESDVFRTMFQLPQASNSDTLVDGMTDERPIVLQGVKSDDFKQFLRVVYARRPLEYDALTLDQWGSVLELSSKWDMEGIRKMVIRNMTPLLANDSHNLVVWGSKFSVMGWISDGLVALVNRLDPMTETDVAKVGLSIVMKIAAIREGAKAREVIEYQGLNSFVNRRTVKEKTAPETEEQIRTMLLAILNGSSAKPS
ncbi:hypothetical protein JR316_0002668 [Psilocybe cubensis]|uniref:BTB domain-containing protein n=2 Tax=Psilocybe cubensis TaxID=181762 RepID=A0A8H7Y3N1_PSICU|nr:hypothetical protein JR316_0002668 [Psilocybe cubensis]KAH9485753.1 hypothetical protein JR316_0002668 [Psilocybe cubensis]